MNGLTTERLAALRASVARVAREKRQRETRLEDIGRLAGRYRGRIREFSLEWVEDECGYRRVFPRVSPGLWEDPTILSDAEAAARVESGEWRLLAPENPNPGAGTWCGSGNAHHVPARQEQAGGGRERTSHQRAPFTDASGYQTRSESPRNSRASSKIDRGPAT